MAVYVELIYVESSIRPRGTYFPSLRSLKRMDLVKWLVPFL